MNDVHAMFLEKASILAHENVKDNGGPFGALIVRNGEIIATGVNRVTANCDSTAHAEMMAIRKAEQILGTIDLSDCILYSSCEPCPMCFGAAHWSRVKHVYFSATRKDAAEHQFDDNLIYEEISLPHNERTLQFTHIPVQNASLPFHTWKEKSDKELY